MSIRIKRNPDGTYTVTCGTEAMIINNDGSTTPIPVFDPNVPDILDAGGFGTAQIIDSTKIPPGAKRADSTDQLLVILKQRRDELSHLPKPKKPQHFALHGYELLNMTDVYTAIMGNNGEPAFTPHIHLIGPRGR